MLRNEILDEAARRLVSHFQPERIILFGSQARGDADARSDADFLVITRFTGKRRSLMLAMDRSLRGLDLARDIVVLTPEEYERDRAIPGTIARPAAQEGKCLYERK
jgi:predicted nucleotidyltransferase